MQNVKGREYLVERGVDRRTILKGISEKWSLRIMIGFIWLRMVSVGGILYTQ
jgi:hypothetical protein